MRSIVIRYLPFTFLIFSFASCYTPRYVYSPPAHNAPVLVKKGDSKIAANYSTNVGSSGGRGFATETKSRGVDLQAAYAFTNHLALQANYCGRRELNDGSFDSNMGDSIVIRYRRKLAEFGIGYYKMLDDNQQVIFQIFAGAGSGKFRFTDIGRDQNTNYHNYFHEMNISKFFLQPALMVRSKKNFAATLSNKISLIKFHHINTNYPAFELDNYKLDSLGNRSHIFWEPATIYTFGFQKLPGLQFEFQLGLAVLQSKSFVDYRSFNFSCGVLLDARKLLKRKPSPSSTK